MLHFERSARVNAPVEVVFAFHERPDALSRLTPPDLRVEVVRREGGIETGATVELRLRSGPFSIKWIAAHTGYGRNSFFVDEQEAGPFRSWKHRHIFEPDGVGTRLTDAIDFELPGGAAVEALFGPLILNRLERLFAYRHEVTQRECESRPGM